MIRALGTIFAALVGLAFGSFLNVCLSRWPEGESVVEPRSHCRTCQRTLAWWENVPLVSWIALRGRCRTCRVCISPRYPLVELAVGVLWALCWYQLAAPSELVRLPHPFLQTGLRFAYSAIFYWILVALAALDVEYLWLPDALTLPGIVLGVIFTLVRGGPLAGINTHPTVLLRLLNTAINIAVAAGIILLIRWIYWAIRRREGIGLGDAKLMALLAAWLPLPETLLAFALGVTMGAAVAISLLALPAVRRDPQRWAVSKLPLGTFLCIGGAISGLWGHQILAAYVHWAGL
jgi:leader peptidase (prepilin peptidase)/N-methyltransferase